MNLTHYKFISDLSIIKLCVIFYKRYMYNVFKFNCLKIHKKKNTTCVFCNYKTLTSFPSKLT